MRASISSHSHHDGSAMHHFAAHATNNSAGRATCKSFPTLLCRTTDPETPRNVLSSVLFQVWKSPNLALHHVTFTISRCSAWSKRTAPGALKLIVARRNLWHRSTSAMVSCWAFCLTCSVEVLEICRLFLVLFFSDYLASLCRQLYLSTICSSLSLQFLSFHSFTTSLLYLSLFLRLCVFLSPGDLERTHLQRRETH